MRPPRLIGGTRFESSRHVLGQVDEAPRDIALGFAATLCLGLAPAMAMAMPKPQLVSRAPTGESANGKTDHAALSRDGRYVAFASQATNLHPDDTDPDYDVYFRDMETGQIWLVSRANGFAGAKANLNSADPSISADGRYVAFASLADNLAPGLL